MDCEYFLDDLKEDSDKEIPDKMKVVSLLEKFIDALEQVEVEVEGLQNERALEDKDDYEQESEKVEYLVDVEESRKNAENKIRDAIRDNMEFEQDLKKEAEAKTEDIEDFKEGVANNAKEESEDRWKSDKSTEAEANILADFLWLENDNGDIIMPAKVFVDVLKNLTAVVLAEALADVHLCFQDLNQHIHMVHPNLIFLCNSCGLNFADFNKLT